MSLKLSINSSSCYQPWLTFDILESDGVLLGLRPVALVRPDLPAGGEEGGVAAVRGGRAGVAQPGVSVAHQAANQPGLAGRAVVHVVLTLVLLVHRPGATHRCVF